MKVCGIYKITNVVNGKTLIGQSTDVYGRLIEHRRLARKNQHHNPYFQSAWNKYGEESFRFEVVFLCSIQDLNETEVNFIRNCRSRTYEHGYNVWSGGDRPKHTEETKRKIGNAHRGSKNCNYGKPLSEETKVKLRMALGGKNHPNYGKHHSAETIEKQRYAKNLMRERYVGSNNPFHGKTHTQETRENMGKSKRGIPLSLEHRQKLSAARKGKPFSEEHKLHMCKAWRLSKLSALKT